MAFKMLYSKNSFPFKHYPKGAGVHGHQNSDGETNYHGKNRNTGRKSTYSSSKDESGVNVLTRNPNSAFGTNKFDE
jgi:hypothetical protein